MVEDDWDFFFRDLSDAPSVVGLNLALGKIAPVVEQPHFACVRVGLAAPLPNGFPSREEGDALARIEDEVTHAVSEACRGRMVGRRTGGGAREIYFYVADPSHLADAVGRVAPRFEGRPVTTRAVHDPAWENFEELWPDRFEHQWIHCRRVVQQLAQHGDQHAVARPVDHYAYFPDAKAAEGFGRAAEAEGFTATPTDVTDPGARPGIHLVRSDAVTLDHIHEVCSRLMVMAEAHGGEYDGWGCPIAKG